MSGGAVTTTTGPVVVDGIITITPHKGSNGIYAVIGNDLKIALTSNVRDVL